MLLYFNNVEIYYEVSIELWEEKKVGRDFEFSYLIYYKKNKENIFEKFTVNFLIPMSIKVGYCRMEF